MSVKVYFEYLYRDSMDAGHVFTQAQLDLLHEEALQDAEDMKKPVPTVEDPMAGYVTPEYCSDVGDECCSCTRDGFRCCKCQNG
jgi:hypothetical protein